MNIKRWIVVSFASLAITALFSINPAYSQTKFAIVDVGAVFKQHPSFKAALEALRGEADRLKADAQQAQQGLAQSHQHLQKEWKPESVEFRNGKAELAKQAAALQVQQNGKIQKLMEQEAELHFSTYQQIKSLISQYCDERGIQLVYRFNSQEMDMSKPGSIMQRVNGSIVYHDPAYDITQVIVGQLGAVANNTGLLERR